MSSKPSSSLTYAAAGVDIDAGNALVERIKPLAKATSRSGVMESLGGFGALFDLKATGYADPVLVSSTDGAGTKIKIAQATGRHDTIGIDLVAMCVNDLVVQGAEPLFFLDYFATSALDVDVAADVVAGIAEGCKQANCALIGGETAEMSDLYAPGEYDLAGFTVGAVERNQLLPRKDVAEGDVVLGLASSGFHSNGYSLVRRVVERAQLTYEAVCPYEKDKTLGEALLTPTRIYVKSCLAAIANGGVKALAHITGGGLVENIPRVLPEALSVTIVKDSWELPAPFAWLAKEGQVEEAEMLRTFNCGIGMVLIVAPDKKEEIADILSSHGETVVALGEVSSAASERVIIR